MNFKKTYYNPLFKTILRQCQNKALNFLFEGKNTSFSPSKDQEDVRFASEISHNFRAKKGIVDRRVL